MNNKVRFTNGYKFNDFPELFWHSGKFWINDNEVKQVYNNGSLSLQIGKSKKSIKQLRKQAVKCRIEIEKYKLPF